MSFPNAFIGNLNAALSSPGLPGGEWRPKGVPSMERENSKRGQILKGAPGLPGGKPQVVDSRLKRAGMTP
ncbi:MAG: hypothetical protein A3G33_05345 [Omnitrophica bacterium RIFCSPLOWO2_12_FULL_44_17]|uniref:Uncharacterized protein n=1 Tax=Candidatus Danuiimicrobium aquiferis TaxID=1801832 RepID=A0A1G1KQ58_9BACT|nr:MAG: hypothetical protein A3B72_05050 [Omnitrophica bacterium RIFCSPHIGHO2_02_FULL_45_28]OGW95057.1 MAG: hypothetical protein A3G33_05345 [Omnitrophica bacterium RIFCSPLOWO2_12_FULL_44_17]OGX02977.1 MAG: hypothetical protein A3J12_01570 [Omnitrophica bacterium RIFCSPLOWO2_02_FULL_44_11]